MRFIIVNYPMIGRSWGNDPIEKRADYQSNTMIFYSLGKNNNNFMQTTIVFLLTNTGKKTAVEEDVWQAVSFPRGENETFRYLRKSTDDQLTSSIK